MSFVSDDDEMPEIATNDEWRAIMTAARKDRGLTQNELGERVELSQVMISKLESGESGSSTAILRICRELGIVPPAHFTDPRDRRWYQLGHVLRHRSPEQFEAALALVESMASSLDKPAKPDEKSGDRRK